LAIGTTELVVQDAIEMTSWVRRVVVVLVGAEDDGDVLALGGRGDDDLLGAGLEVLGGVVALGEEPGRLDDDVDAEVASTAGRRVALGETLMALAVDDEVVAVVHLDGAVEAAVDAVVLQQQRQRRRCR
jgi:hypothetical protein